MAWIILVAVAIVFAVLAMCVMIYLAVHLTRVEAGLRQAATLFNQLAETMDNLAAPLGNLAAHRAATKQKPPDHPETWDEELGCMTPAIATSAVYRSKTHATTQAPTPPPPKRRTQTLRRAGSRKATPRSRRAMMLAARKRRPARHRPSKASQMLSKLADHGPGPSAAPLLPDPGLTIPPPLALPPPTIQRKNILGSATVSPAADI